MRAPSFAVYCAARAALEEESAAASGALNAIAGVGAGPMGLTPDSVKFAPAYRAARARYESAAAALRRLIRANAKAFARELREERKAYAQELARRRAAKLEERNS